MNIYNLFHTKDMFWVMCLGGFLSTVYGSSITAMSTLLFIEFDRYRN